MKKLIILISGLIIAIFASSQPTIHISEPISVTGNSTNFGRHLPKIDALEDGTVLVFWSKPGSNSGLFLAKLNGEDFDDVIEVPTGSIQPDIWGGGLGPDFVIYDNTIFITFEKWGQSIYCVKSNDGGVTFDEPVIAFTPPSGRAATLPTIAIDNQGNPIIGCITTNLSEQDAKYEIFRSMDGGENFEQSVEASNAADGEEVCECCPSHITVSNDDQIYVSFRNNNSNIRDIWISRSTDEGQSYPDAVDVDQTNWFIQGCPSTGPQSIEIGNSLVNVFFSSGENWAPGVYLSTLNKSSFEAGEMTKLPHFENTNNLQNFPRISGKIDTLGIVWHENNGSFNKIAFVWSPNGVEEISEYAISINNSNAPQVYPDIMFKNGKFHIVYEDLGTGTVLYQTTDFQSMTSILPQIISEQDLKVWPNPVTERVNISLSNHNNDLFCVQISDLLGQTVLLENNVKGDLILDVKQFVKGIYLVKVSLDQKYWLQKIVIR